MVESPNNAARMSRNLRTEKPLANCAQLSSFWQRREPESCIECR